MHPFFRQKNPGAEAPGFSYAVLHGEPVRQRIGDRINDRLRLLFAALAEDIGSDAKASLNKTHVTLPLSSDFQRRPTQ